MAEFAENEVPVLIVGAGPVGLSLALGLSRYGVRSVLVEKNAGISEHSKAPGILPRTLEIFRQWGILEAVRAEGNLLPRPTGYNAADNTPFITLDLAALSEELAGPGLCILEQSETERILLEAVQASGRCEVRFCHRLTGLNQEANGVHARIESEGGDYGLRAQYLIGCDGASSTVRDLLDLPFDGITYPVRAILADVRIEDERNQLPWPRGISNHEVAFTLQLPSGLWRIVAVAPAGAHPEEEAPEIEADYDEVEHRVCQLLGPGGFDLVWASSFQIHCRTAPRFRAGRVLLAGDAAHVNSPVGGQGMNSGIQDAHNLAWKLAFVLEGGDSDRLLDSYDRERGQVVRHGINPFTDFLTRALALSPGWVRAAFLVVARNAMRIPPLRRRAMRQMGMLAYHYPESPLLSSGQASGRRLPDVELIGPGGERTRLHDLVGDGPALLFLETAPVMPEIGVPLICIRIGRGSYRDPSGLLRRRLGLKRGVALIRPDHSIAWAKGSVSETALRRSVCHALGLPLRERRPAGAYWWNRSPQGA